VTPAAAKIPLGALARAGQRRVERIAKPFDIPRPPPWIPKEQRIAMDQAIVSFSNTAQGELGSVFAEGEAFMGYAYLALLAQRSEYRRIVECIASELTRKWIRDRCQRSRHLSSGAQRQRSKAIERCVMTRYRMFSPEALAHFRKFAALPMLPVLGAYDTAGALRPGPGVSFDTWGAFDKEGDRVQDNAGH